jgi:hypothetical protein
VRGMGVPRKVACSVTGDGEGVKVRAILSYCP